MYHLFWFDTFYPEGGGKDYFGGYETLEDLKKDANSLNIGGDHQGNICNENMEVIFECRCHYDTSEIKWESI